MYLYYIDGLYTISRITHGLVVNAEIKRFFFVRICNKEIVLARPETTNLHVPAKFIYLFFFVCFSFRGLM